MYGWGIGLAVRHSFPVSNPTPELMPGIFLWFVSSIGVLLATNLGSIMGVEIPSRKFSLKGLSTQEIIRGIAAVMFLLSTGVVFYFWYKTGFAEDPTKVVSTLPEFGRILPGVFLASLAVALGVTVKNRNLSSHSKTFSYPPDRLRLRILH